MGEILIGTSGFSFNDWVGTVYPSGLKKQQMLQYYESCLGFKTLEINYTYYSMPTARTMVSFRDRTSPEFSFTVKAHKSMTHERPSDVKQIFQVFKTGLAPLNGRVKTVLFQFPYSFVPNRENIEYLRIVQGAFEKYGSVVEFRNVQWSYEQYLDLLKSVGLGYCVVDEPKLKGLLPFSPHLTSDTGYFRFHGRNTSWFNAPMEVRYNYSYSEEELRQFVQPIKEVAEKAKATYVFFNNCHDGQAAKNALMMIEIMKSSQ